MKKMLILSLLLLLLIPIKVKSFETSGSCAILMDQDSHKILYGKNIHTVRSVASISKIMTAIIAIESNKLDDVVKIGSEINDAYGSAIYIKENEEMKLIDLIYGLMLRSGNDAALAIAHYVGGSVNNFIEAMNKKAKEIGMKNTKFNNPSGLDEKEGNFSTAYDMAILTSYAMKNETYRKVVQTKKHNVKTNMNVYSWTNKNKLLNSYKYTTGGKTGYTEIAKRTLVTTASKDNINLVAVTLNDGNDFSDHKNLYEEAFNNYQSYQILKKGTINIIDDKYYRDYYLYIKDDYKYLMNKEEKSVIYLKFEMEKKHGFNENDVVGTVKVMVADKEVFKTNVYVGKNKTKTSFNIIKWFKSLW